MSLLVKEWYDGVQLAWRRAFPKYIPTRIEQALVEFIEENMAKPKRPPLEWNGEKELRYPIAIFANGVAFYNILRYSVPGRWFEFDCNGVNKHISGCNFLVKRMA